MAHEPLPPSRPPCAAAIVFAMAVEADAFAAAVREAVDFEAAGLTIREGLCADRRVAWCVGGAGAAAATRATRLLIDGHRPGIVVTAGFAGGLDAGIPRGALVRPSRSVTTTGGPALELASGQRTGSGLSIVSVDRVVTTAAAKRDLAAATGAAVVDMETHAVATAARDAGLPCAALRVISDDASQDLPREIAALVQPQSGMRRLGAALGAIGRRPRAAFDMWALWEHAVVDGRTLAAAIEAFVRGL
jgi:adenosylhomocysteine nucleosidase